MKKQNKLLNTLSLFTIIALFIKFKEKLINFINPYEDDKIDNEIVEKNDDENLI